MNFQTPSDIEENNQVISIQRAEMRIIRRKNVADSVEIPKRYIGLYQLSIYRNYIIPFVVSPFSQFYRLIIRGVLPEVIIQKNFDSDTMNYLLQDWQRLDHRYLPNIAIKLKRALVLNSLFGRWMLFGPIFLIVIYFLIRFLSSKSFFVESKGSLIWYAFFAFWILGAIIIKNINKLTILLFRLSNILRYRRKS